MTTDPDVEYDAYGVPSRLTYDMRPLPTFTVRKMRRVCTVPPKVSNALQPL